MNGRRRTLLAFVSELTASDICQVLAWFVTRGFHSFVPKAFGGWAVSFGEYGFNIDAKRRNHDGKLGVGKGLTYTELRAINIALSNVAFLVIAAGLNGMSAHDAARMGIASLMIMATAWAFFLRGKSALDWQAVTVGVLVCLVVVSYLGYDGMSPVVPHFGTIGAYLAAAIWWTSARWIHLHWPQLGRWLVIGVCWFVGLGEYAFLALASLGHVATIPARGWTDVTQNFTLVLFLLTQKKVTRLTGAGFGLFFMLSAAMFIVAR